MDAQRTLRRAISCVGIGLHSGNKVQLSLKPAPINFGIRFRRADLGDHEVPANVQHLAGIQLATALSRNEVSVETVEHLLAALVSMGVDNVLIELNSPEVPIMDGSAAPFIYLLDEAGIKRLSAGRRFLKVLRPIAMSQGDKRIALYPSDHFKVTYSISFDHPLLRHQSRTLRITEESFIEEIAPARTFTFLKDVENHRQNGLGRMLSNFRPQLSRRGKVTSKPPDLMPLATRREARLTGIRPGIGSMFFSVSGVSIKPGFITWMRTFILSKSYFSASAILFSAALVAP